MICYSSIVLAFALAKESSNLDCLIFLSKCLTAFAFGRNIRSEQDKWKNKNNEMVREIKSLMTKTDDLSSIPGTHKVEGEDCYP